MKLMFLVVKLTQNKEKQAIWSFFSKFFFTNFCFAAANVKAISLIFKKRSFILSKKLVKLSIYRIEKHLALMKKQKEQNS